MGSILVPFQLATAAPFSLLKSIFFFPCFDCRFGRPQIVSRGAQQAPGSPQECRKSVQEAPESAPGGPQEEAKRPQELVKRGQDRPSSPLKAPKDTEEVSDTEKHYPQDNGAYQCCSDRKDRQRQKAFHPRRSSDWPGGRRCSPLGEAIRRPPRSSGRSRACWTDFQKPKPQPNLHILKP